jgi:hypothetical protein
MSAWINEFHYDNAGTDTGEFVEVIVPTGADLSRYSVVLYNGNGGAPYDTRLLSAAGNTVTDLGGGFTSVVIRYASNGVQNGDPDGLALVGPAGVIEFLSYEGVFTAVGGPASGMTSVDVGVRESGSVNGTSLARVGTGDEASDFRWVLAADDTPEAVNIGQTLVGGPRVDGVSVSDASVAEGDDGVRLLTFTITRSDASSTFTVSYTTQDGTAQAGTDYAAAVGSLTFLAGGVLSQQVSIAVQGDTIVEPTEFLRLNLSNLQVTSGRAELRDASGEGAITNDDIARLAIYEIQGAGHTSPYVGQQVLTQGVVTAVDTTGSRGFWIQDATGDGDAATSDGVFVFTGTVPTVRPGDLVSVTGTVSEFRGSNANNLTMTQLISPVVATIGTGVVQATVLGAGGRLPPTETIDDDRFGLFDPRPTASTSTSLWKACSSPSPTLRRCRRPRGPPSGSSATAAQTPPA